MVVLEAMACQLPVVCLKYGGPGEMVTPECGFSVEIADMKTTVKKLAKALTILSESQKTREQLGKSAAKRAKQIYLWEKRSNVIDKWYTGVVNRTYTYD